MKGNKAWIITTAVGATLLVVSAVVFSVSARHARLTAHAEAVHIADETLRVATVARAQVAMANHFASMPIPAPAVVPIPREFANMHSLVVGNDGLGEGWRIFFRTRTTSR